MKSARGILKRRANDPFAGGAKGRAEKLIANRQGWLRPPFCAPETGREADAEGRAASPRGCARQRRRPLAGEPRGSASLHKTDDMICYEKY